jgi:transposase
VSATAAGDCIQRARRAGLGWPLPEGLTEEALECRLYPPPPIAAKDRRPRPDWAAVHRELRRPGVTCARHAVARQPRRRMYAGISQLAREQSLVARFG